jgi:hypothetical protein
MIVMPIKAFAAPSSSYQSGYKHGCDDVDKLPDSRYINTIGQEASHHTSGFMNGYHQGFMACGGSKTQDSSDFPDLKPGQHYGICEEKGDDNHLACDVDNDDGSLNPSTLEDGTPNIPHVSNGSQCADNPN